MSGNNAGIGPIELGAASASKNAWGSETVHCWTYGWLHYQYQCPQVQANPAQGLDKEQKKIQLRVIFNLAGQFPSPTRTVVSCTRLNKPAN